MGDRGLRHHYRFGTRQPPCLVASRGPFVSAPACGEDLPFCNGLCGGGGDAAVAESAEGAIVAEGPR